MIPLGEWLPDIPEHDLKGLVTAKNCVPWNVGYRSWPTQSLVSNALTGTCLGAVSVKDSTGNVETYAGDSTKLYLLASATFSSAGTGYTVASGDVWEFAQFGDSIIAANGTDALQTDTIGTGTFAALGGSPPIGKHLAVVKDFLIVGNISSAPNRVQWSATNNITGWTVGADQSDYQDFPNGGHVKRVIGGEYGTVVQESQISRMTYVGPDLIFQFDVVDRDKGAVASQSVVSLGGIIFYLAEDGFYMFDGEKSVPIGNGKIDKWFYSELDQNYFDKVIGVLDPINKLVVWTFPGSGSSNGLCNKALIFNWSVGKWSYAEFDSEYIFRGLSGGLTMDAAAMDALAGDDLDSLTVSLDSRYYTGGAFVLHSFTSAHKMAAMTGDAGDAVLVTGDIELNPGGSAFVQGVRPLYTGDGTASIRLGSKNIIANTPSYSAATSVTSSTGFHDFRKDARYHRGEITITGGFENFYALDVRQAKSGMR